jgi:hypothetical protein
VLVDIARVIPDDEDEPLDPDGLNGEAGDGVPVAAEQDDGAVEDAEAQPDVDG